MIMMYVLVVIRRKLFTEWECCSKPQHRHVVVSRCVSACACPLPGAGLPPARKFKEGIPLRATRVSAHNLEEQ